MNLEKKIDIICGGYFGIVSYEEIIKFAKESNFEFNKTLKGNFHKNVEFILHKNKTITGYFSERQGNFPRVLMQ